jgi:hypothetical protein
MLSNAIPIDFVAGSHGHFLENTLNKHFGIVSNTSDFFTPTGTSHQVTPSYLAQRLFYAEHWSERYKDQLYNISPVISIRFDPDDLLLLSSVSLLRAADKGINNDDLEIDTVNKLNNLFYKDVLELIFQSYPFLNRSDNNIPRYVLREFYKFGFRDPLQNGYWKKLTELTYNNRCKVFYFNLKDFYDINLYVARIKELELFLDRKFEFSKEFYQQHQKFISFIPYINHKSQCDNIISCIQQGIEVDIPKLTLFQESYINGNLENIFVKEMPFCQNRYFTSTKDVLYYITTHAPNL